MLANTFMEYSREKNRTDEMTLKLHLFHQQSKLLYRYDTIRLNSTLDMHDIIKSSPDDNTQL